MNYNPPPPVGNSCVPGFCLFTSLVFFPLCEQGLYLSWWVLFPQHLAWDRNQLNDWMNIWCKADTRLYDGGSQPHCQLPMCLFLAAHTHGSSPQPLTTHVQISWVVLYHSRVPQWDKTPFPLRGSWLGILFSGGFPHLTSLLLFARITTPLAPPK